MKKALKILGIVLGIVILALAIIPFAFQSQIQEIVKRYLNANLNAKVEFNDVNLSFFRDFPQAQVDVYDLNITNLEPFENENLATAKSISFSMSVKELFKNSEDEPIVVNSIDIDEALLTLKVDAFGNENFDIVKQDSTTQSSSFAFDIEEYKISNSALTYIDETSEFVLHASGLEHSGNAKFRDDISELDTQSQANVSLSIDSIQYLNNNKVKLDALIDMDLNASKYTFKENTGYINQLPLEFEGWLQQLENGQDMDIRFKNPESSFKSFLAIIPEAYSKNFDDVETTGDFLVNGHIQGVNSQARIPNIDIKIQSNNASFKYPDLPKAVSDITIDMSVLNETGNMDDTYVDIGALNFRIDQDKFNSNLVLRELNKNMKVSANIDGTLNLANLTRAYPIDLEQELSGIMKGNIKTSFDMEAIEKNAYQRINNSGSVTVSDMVFSTEALAKPIQISQADLNLNDGNVKLTNFKAVTGKSDMSATGSINNLLGFMLSDKALQGNFNLNSNNFVVSDFMTDTADANVDGDNQASSANKAEAVKIPDFLDCRIIVKANNVAYDNLDLNNVSGTLSISDQQARLENVTSDLFNGILALEGDVSTKSDTPIFNMNIAADGFDISSSFEKMDLLRNLAPIAKILQGKLNTSLSLSGSLKDDLSPNLTSLKGNALAELLTSVISPETSNVLKELGGELNFIDFSKLDLKDLKTKLDFSNGMVNVKPFDFKYKDIEIIVSGSHSFENTMDYNATFNVPAKYLGSEVNRLIGKINDNDVNEITVPVSAIITGSFSNPKISTDLSSSVSKLTKQLIEIEKQKLLNNGKGKILELLGGIEQPKDKPTEKEQDSTFANTNPITNPQGIFKTDSTKSTGDTVKEGVKGILGGLIKNKKKDKDKDEEEAKTERKQDSVKS